MTLRLLFAICSEWSILTRPDTDNPLSKLIQSRLILRVRCHACKTLHHYRPEDVLQIFGDVDANCLHHRIKCEKCRSNLALSVDYFQPVGSEAVGMKIRRLVAIKLLRGANLARGVGKWRAN